MGNKTQNSGRAPHRRPGVSDPHPHDYDRVPSKKNRKITKLIEFMRSTIIDYPKLIEVTAAVAFGYGEKSVEPFTRERIFWLMRI